MYNLNKVEKITYLHLLPFSKAIIPPEKKYHNHINPHSYKHTSKRKKSVGVNKGVTTCGIASSFHILE